MSATTDMTTSLMTMPEHELLANVVQMARWLGWRVYHTHDSRQSAAGFPDICAVRARPGESPRLLFVELKRARGVVSEAQRHWLVDLIAVEHVADAWGAPASISVHIWRPHDWVSGVIEQALR